MELTMRWKVIVSIVVGDCCIYISLLNKSREKAKISGLFIKGSLASSLAKTAHNSSNNFISIKRFWVNGGHEVYLVINIMN